MEKCLHWRCLSLISTEFQTLSLTTVENINPAVWPLPTLCSILNFWAATVSCAKSLLTFMSKSLRFVSFLHLSGIISLDFFMPFHHSWKFLPSCPVCRYEITSQSVIFKSEKQTSYINTAYHDSRESRHWSETGDACGVTWIQHVGNHPTDTCCHKSGIQGVTTGEHQRSAVQHTCMWKKVVRTKKKYLLGVHSNS